MAVNMQEIGEQLELEGPSAGGKIPRWQEQHPSMSTLDFLKHFRAAVVQSIATTGSFEVRGWDHNDPDYRPGNSNKMIKIHGALLLHKEGNPTRTPDSPFLDYKVARAAVVKAAL